MTIARIDLLRVIGLGDVVGGRIREVDAQVLEVRNLTYRMFVDLGRAPTAEEVARAAGVSSAQVEAVWRELHHAHALVLDPATADIRMANPFSAVPTAYRVHAAGRQWYGNCAWDAVGICAALHADGRIETACPDCGEVIALEVRDQRVDDERLFFHCLVPAAHWWDDIIFT
jgi:Alkylmercury lyase